MESSGTSSKSRSRPSGRNDDAPSVTPILPLLLLETLRDRDRPEEVLEDEDITLSMPRRLGLSEVVRVQIQRFEAEVRHRRPQVPSQIEDLMRLVIRRPDCEAIFGEAGRRVAERYWSQRSNSLRRAVRLLPRPLAMVAAQRAGKRMFGDLVGPSRFRITRRPAGLRIESTLTSRADPGGAACSFYSGAFKALLELYTGRRYRVLHSACACKLPDGPCEWSVELAD
jgi:predicted hydrocarbon binding protein